MDKVFFGNVKEMTNDYWTMYSIWIPKDDLNKLVFNEKWWANLSLKKSSKWNWYMEIYNPNWQGWQGWQVEDDWDNWEDLPF